MKRGLDLVGWCKTLVVAGALFVAVTDLAFYLAGGEEATVSRVVLEFCREWPIVAFASGVVAGHLFWPQTP